MVHPATDGEKDHARHPVAVTDATFDQHVVNAKGPVLVDFWAPWCGPCRMVAPILDQISDELGEKITIVKVNVDENQQIAGNLGIMSIPTLMLYKGGKPVETIIGFQPKNKLMEKIQGHLN
ncbi:MAG: thioredoxin [Chloroflexota bacterium]|nr:thioredoxin [Chloroflexota bacterium]